MSFLSTLLDAFVSFSEKNAQQIDRMSSEDIKQKFISKNPDKSVSDYRNFARTTHKLSNKLSDRKNQGNNNCDE